MAMMDDVDPRLAGMWALMLQQAAMSTGANQLMGFGPDGRTQRGNMMGTSAPLDSGEWKQSVGGPGQSIGPNYAPQGVIFPGGSPFPVDTGPANFQNAMVAFRDLMNTPLAQQALAKLKQKMSGT